VIRGNLIMMQIFILKHNLKKQRLLFAEQTFVGALNMCFRYLWPGKISVCRQHEFSELALCVFLYLKLTGQIICSVINFSFPGALWCDLWFPAFISKHCWKLWENTAVTRGGVLLGSNCENRKKSHSATSNWHTSWHLIRMEVKEKQVDALITGWDFH